MTLNLIYILHLSVTIKILIQASNVRNFSNGLIPTFPDIKEIEGLRCISKFMMGRSSVLGH